MGKLRREAIVALLRDAGRDEAADRAERELPARVDTERMEAKLRSLGLRPGGGISPGSGAGADSSGGMDAGSFT